MYEVPANIEYKDHCLMRLTLIVWRFIACSTIIFNLGIALRNIARLDYLRTEWHTQMAYWVARQGDGITVWADASMKIAFFVWITTFLLKSKTPVLHKITCSVFILCICLERYISWELTKMMMP